MLIKDAVSTLEVRQRRMWW